MPELINCLESIFRPWGRDEEPRSSPEDFLRRVGRAENPGRTKSKVFRGQGPEEERAAWSLSYSDPWKLPLGIRQVTVALHEEAP